MRGHGTRTAARLAYLAGFVLCAELLGTTLDKVADAAPIFDSYGRIIGFTPDEEAAPPSPAPPAPPPASAAEDDWETDALIEDLRRRIAKRDTDIQKLQQRAEAISDDLASTQGRERTLLGEVAYLNRQIEGMELQIAITESRIEAVNLRIEQLELQIAQHEEQIAKNHERLAEVLRTMQVSENQVGPVALVFAARPFSDIFDSLREAELLDSSLTESLARIKQAKEEIERAKEESITEREAAETLRDELRIRQTLVEQEQSGRDALLSETRQEEHAYRNMLSEVEQQQRAIESDIRALEAQLRQTIDPSALPGDGALTWPVDSVRITQGYGATSTTGFVNDTYDFHNGVDFGASVRGVAGDPIKAATGGRVVGVGNTGKYAYGRWIAINHDNGLVTLYAHLSLQQVSVGQRVERGAVIGRMGSTGFSTGAHLHFTVYAAESFRIEPRWYGSLPIGASFDPMQFL